MNDPVVFLNVAIHSDEEYETTRWHLTTSLGDPKQAIRGYKRRVWIEQTLKDFKLRVLFQKIHEKKHLDKRVVPSCLS